MEEKNTEQPSGTDKRLETLSVETEKQKKALVAQLRKTPIVQLACEKADVGRSTYYKWRIQDKIFARAADQAKAAGRFLVNDVAESRLLNLIQNDNLTAIIFWLKHNHPNYSAIGRIIHEYSLIRENRSVEETQSEADMVARMLARREQNANRSWFRPDEVKTDIEEEERDAESEKEDDEKLEGYNES